jgi:hypothetical protein
MSEDEAAALEQEVEAQLAAEREDFEALFPPEAFTGIAKALKIRPKPEYLSRLRGWLLPDFYEYLCWGHPGKKPTRKDRIKRVKKLREAAMSLHFSLTHFDGIWMMDWPLDVLAPDDDRNAPGVTDQFTATLQLLVDRAATLIENIASEKSRRGRPVKNAPFRELTPILVRKYERLTKEPAERPYFLPDSRIYDGKGSFYPFVRAVWCCLRTNLPAEARDSIPSTEGALAQELQNHWPEDRTKDQKVKTRAR